MNDNNDNPFKGHGETRLCLHWITGETKESIEALVKAVDSKLTVFWLNPGEDINRFLEEFAK